MTAVNFNWGLAVHRQLDITGTMTITPSMTVRGKECDKLVARYRRARRICRTCRRQACRDYRERVR